MISFENEGSDGKRVRILTKLQSVVVIFVLLIITAFSVNSIIIYGVDKRPSVTLFENSQTTKIFSDYIPKDK